MTEVKELAETTHVDVDGVKHARNCIIKSTKYILGRLLVSLPPPPFSKCHLGERALPL